MQDTPQAQPIKQRSVKRALWKRWLVLWPVTLALMVYPVSNTALRLAMIACFILLVSGLVAFNWRHRWLKIALVSVTVFLLAFLLWPGRKAHIPSLQHQYLESLRRYEGVRYVWGGENRFGIDCSGLVRRGLVNGLLNESFRTVNPALIRQGLFIWWNDCSARAMGEEHRHLTTSVIESDSINRIDPTQIEPGDFAVTADGIHVVAYLGGNEWIEADPDAKRVLRLTTPSTNSWFDTPVRVMRWTLLKGE